jgi:diguanylate cyclase (GGDEF)-like protein
VSEPPERSTKKVHISDFVEVVDDDEAHTTAVTNLEDIQSTLGADRRWALTFLSGAAAGRVIPLDAGVTVVGRSSAADVQERDDSLSRKHAAFLLEDDAAAVQDLGSTNGTFVNGARIEGPTTVESGARVQLGLNTIVRVQKLSPAELETAQRLWDSSTRDPLTGVNNRRDLDHRMEAEYAFASRHRRPLSVLMLDIDHFKHVNDSLGHQAGDAVLVALGTYLTSAVRTEDVVARYGGEEFVLVLRDEDAGGAQIVAERVRAHVEEMEIEWESEAIRITASLGVATHAPLRPYGSAGAVIAAADECLYRAKRSGRNLVIADASPRSVPPSYA